MGMACECCRGMLIKQYAVCVEPRRMCGANVARKGRGVRTVWSDHLVHSVPGHAVKDAIGTHQLVRRRRHAKSLRRDGTGGTGFLLAASPPVL